MGIWDNTIYDNSPISWGQNDAGAISTAINNNVNNTPNYNAISGAIDNYVNSANNNGFNWGQFGKNMLNNSGNLTSGGQSQSPQISYRPTMMQPQYINTNFENKTSNVAQNNLYNNLMR